MGDIAIVVCQSDDNGGVTYIYQNVHIWLRIKSAVSSFEQRGKKKIVRVNADPRVDTGDSHAPVPFYVTTGGYGVYVDNARYMTFYFGGKVRRPTSPSGVARKQDEERAARREIEKWKLERAKALEKMDAAERKAYLEQHKKDVEAERQAYEKEQADLKALVEEMREDGEKKPAEVKK